MEGIYEKEEMEFGKKNYEEMKQFLLIYFTGYKVQQVVQRS